MFPFSMLGVILFGYEANEKVSHIRCAYDYTIRSRCFHTPTLSAMWKKYDNNIILGERE